MFDDVDPVPSSGTIALLESALLPHGSLLSLGELLLALLFASPAPFFLKKRKETKIRNFERVKAKPKPTRVVVVILVVIDLNIVDSFC